MPSSGARRRGARQIAGLAALALLVIAGLLPGTGVIASSTNCPYNNCSTSSSTPVPLWLWSLLAVLIIVALLLAVVLIRRRRSPPSGGPVTAWSGTEPGGGPEGPEGPAPAAEEAPVGGGTVVPAGAAYLEGPEDVGQQPPSVPGPATAPGEEDIDSLMKELDKISGEILKRGPPDKKTPADEAGGDSADSGGSQ